MCATTQNNRMKVTNAIIYYSQRVNISVCGHKVLITADFRMYQLVTERMNSATSFRRPILSLNSQRKPIQRLNYGLISLFFPGRAVIFMGWFIDERERFNGCQNVRIPTAQGYRLYRSIIFTYLNLIFTDSIVHLSARALITMAHTHTHFGYSVAV